MDYQRARQVLRDQRHDLEMSVRKLAERSKVERTTIYRIEKLRKVPKYEPDFQTIEKLCNAMDLPLSEFFARVERIPGTDSVQEGYSEEQQIPKEAVKQPAQQEPLGPHAGAGTTIPHDDRPFCARLTGACLDALRAIPASDRRRRRLLEDLALAFSEAAAQGIEGSEIPKTVARELQDINAKRREG